LSERGLIVKLIKNRSPIISILFTLSPRASRGWGRVVGPGVLMLLASACSGPSPFFGDDNSDDNSSNDGGTNDGSSSNDGSNPQADGSTPDATTQPEASVDAGVDTGTTITVDNSDGFGAARQACINEINKLRATESHAAYTIWDTPSIDTCVDEQATYDQEANSGKGSAHDAWLNNVYPTCNGNAQDECLGYGTSASQVVACLDAMWDERLQSNCSGCAACNGTTLTESIINCQSTSTCDFYGNYGMECGHYLNMSADYFSYAACGFSTEGVMGDWAVQNFK
jgi:hypothetical protein